jgi:hypothetical protein
VKCPVNRNINKDNVHIKAHANESPSPIPEAATQYKYKK